jgi:Mlc titration factor MtfA (ptsG expression regulator)
VLFSWLRSRRRAKLLAEPMPPEWLGYLERNVPLHSRLTEAEQARLRDILRVLVAEKQWEGCGGLTMTDEVKVTVAAHAALLLLGIDHDYFARVMSILVYPSGFRSPEGWTRADGVVDLSAGALGEAWYDGPIVLAWDSVLAGGRDPRDGRNVVLHEFAHQLDYLDGVADGTPPLRRGGDYRRWQEVMTREYERLKAESERGEPKVLDSYGATNHAEFFAVATEAFFEKSRQMYARHPELYAVLSEYYGQDPAGRRADTDGETASVTADERSPHVKHVPQQALPGKRNRRRSRRAARVATHAAGAANWPGWVRFWEIHPGVSREQALRPLDHHATGVVCFGAMILFAVGLSYLDHWRHNLGIIMPGLLCLTMVVFAVWLRLAVRWVDRHGHWGGEYRAPEPKPEAVRDEATIPEG